MINPSLKYLSLLLEELKEIAKKEVLKAMKACLKIIKCSYAIKTSKKK